MNQLDTAKMRDAWRSDRIGSHWDGCAYGSRHHEGCAIEMLCREVDRLRARVVAAEKASADAVDIARATKELLRDCYSFLIQHDGPGYPIDLEKACDEQIAAATGQGEK